MTYRATWSGPGTAARAAVWVDGERVRQVALDAPRRLQVEGQLGTSTLEVEPGRIRVADSPGRRKLCVRAGWLSRPGASVVCLPNRVSVRVAGRAAVDAMNH